MLKWIRTLIVWQNTDKSVTNVIIIFSKTYLETYLKNQKTNVNIFRILWNHRIYSILPLIFINIHLKISETRIKLWMRWNYGWLFRCEIISFILRYQQLFENVQTSCLIRSFFLCGKLHWIWILHWIEVYIQMLMFTDEPDLTSKLGVTNWQRRCKHKKVMGVKYNSFFGHGFLLRRVYTFVVLYTLYILKICVKQKNNKVKILFFCCSTARNNKNIYLLACTTNRPAIMIILTRSTTGFGFWSSFNGCIINILSALSWPILLFPRDSCNNRQ